jgi:sucrose-phosphate synthase
VVANRHHEELSQLTDTASIYFAEKPYAAGLLEAIDHYRFFDACQVPIDPSLVPSTDVTQDGGTDTQTTIAETQT